MQQQVNTLFSERANNIPTSFIREILKVVSEPGTISYAGGLPNPELFPARELEECATSLLKEKGNSALQYSAAEGFYPLRKFIAERYDKLYGMKISPEEILITNGSQQALDLCAKILINEGDKVLLEKPSYLGAIQCLSAYQPEFIGVEMEQDGLSIESLKCKIQQNTCKAFYSVPTFQNPSGISYSLKKRKQISEILKDTDIILIEDDPYSEIRFEGNITEPLKKFLPDQTILLGSFSKIISPGLRMGWAVAPKPIMEKLVLAKQAADLHSNFFSQRMIFEYLNRHDLDSHIRKICDSYRKQRDHMIKMMRHYFPPEITFNNPDGGMFLWLKLGKGMNAETLLEKCMKEKVVFVPGSNFYIDDMDESTIRMNFTNSTLDQIEKGIAVIASKIEGMKKGSAT